MQIGSITLTNTAYPLCQYFIAKISPDGNVIWARNAANAPGSENDVLSGSIRILGTGGIATDVAGNVYITTNFRLQTVSIGGYSLTNNDITGSSEDILIAKYDPHGNVVWAKSVGGVGDDHAYGLTVTPSGDVYIAGIFSSPSIIFGPSTITDASGGIGNAFIARFNNLGDPVWASGSGGLGGEFGVGVAADASGNVYLTGGLQDTSISFSGTTIANPSSRNLVLYLVKFGTSNNVLWYKTIADSLDGAWGYSIAMSPCGAIWVSGSFTQQVNIDGHSLVCPPGSNDPVFIAGFNTDGSYAGCAALQSGADDQNGIACDAMGNVYMCADYLCSPFIIANDTLADVTVSSAGEWLYLSKYTFTNVSSPDTFYAHQDTGICTISSGIIDVPPGYKGYIWNDGSTGDSISIDKAGVYWVIGTGGCTIIDTISVVDNPALCACEVSLPSAFTPNNDGINDTYHPLFPNSCLLTSYAFSIYNRWGQQVFYSEDPSAKWDGTFQGIKAELGVYMYYLKYNSGLSNALHSTKGYVTLIR